MRVVAGTAGGLKLKTRDSEATKPTLDRVKEAMFSMLTFETPGATVLDLFSGSGSLGIEALSRGAESAVFCDKDKECTGIIEENLRFTKLADKATVMRGDFSDNLKILSEKGKKFTLVILDPPYRQGLEQEAVKLIEKYSLFTGNTTILTEHAFDDKMPDKIGIFEKIKEKKYGTVGVSLYKVSEERSK